LAIGDKLRVVRPVTCPEGLVAFLQLFLEEGAAKRFAVLPSTPQQHPCNYKIIDEIKGGDGPARTYGFIYGDMMMDDYLDILPVKKVKLTIFAKK
jgi:hypothetical protein